MTLLPVTVPVQEIRVEGPPPQDPGWLIPLVPALSFLVLAAIAWWIWRRLAED